MIDGKNFFDQPVKNNKVTYEILETLLLVKEMVKQLVVCQVIFTLKNITK